MLNIAHDYRDSQRKKTLYNSLVSSPYQTEWLKSVVDTELIDLNVVFASGYEPSEFLLYGLTDKERRNDGRLRNKWLKRYAHLEQGGWWVSGVNVLTGEDSLWGQFKPDHPYTYEVQKGTGYKTKTVKYETPPKVPTEIIALKVPQHLWQKISDNCGVPLPTGASGASEAKLGFWKWVIDNPAIPLIVTEGAKKAGCLLTAGHVAIALPGINNGYRTPKDETGKKVGKPYLIPQLEVFAQKSREINFCFDNDSKPETVKNVRTAIAKTGKLFQAKGCTVNYITWDYPEKGVDDLIATRGVEVFNTAYEARKSIDELEIQNLTDLTSYVNETVNARYLEKLEIPETAQIIGLKSDKGTGKTQELAKIIENDTRVIVITHRIQLAKELAHRFNIAHVDELTYIFSVNIIGYALCIDSLHPESTKTAFNPNIWDGATIVIDECEQVLWHVLDSSTCQNKRVPILQTLKQLIETVTSTGGKIYLSDADLSPLSINFIKALAGKSIETYVVNNEFKPSRGKRTAKVYTDNSPAGLWSDCEKAIALGEKVMIHTSGQKSESTWGTQNLESRLKQQFPDRKILRIDAESIADPNHPAYGCMGNLKAIVSMYDIVIASPTIETGVSIDVKHFDSVWAIAWGLQTVNSVCQSVERVRDDVPRYLWVRAYSSERVGNGSSNPYSIAKTEQSKTQINIASLNQAGMSDDWEIDTIFLKTWAKYAAIVNYGMKNYRKAIVDKLIDSGYEVIEVAGNEETIKETKAEVKAVKEENFEQYCEAVATQNPPSEERYQELENKTAKTEKERLEAHHGKLQKLYGVPVTPELVAKDSKGWYSQLRLHYYLTVGREFVTEKDQATITNLLESGGGKIFSPDVNKKSLTVPIQALEAIDIGTLLDPSASHTNNSLIPWLEKLRSLGFSVKECLGITITDKSKPVRVANSILDKLDLKLEGKRARNGDGKLEWSYRLTPTVDNRDEIFAVWLERDIKKRDESESCSTCSNSNTYIIRNSGTKCSEFDTESQDKVSEATKQPELVPIVSDAVADKSEVTDSTSEPQLKIGDRVFCLLRETTGTIVGFLNEAMAKIELDNGNVEAQDLDWLELV